MANQPTKYSKFLVGAASAALVATAVAPVVSAADFTDSKDFGDHAAAIQALVDLGVVKGYTDGSFKPNQELTRNNVVKFLGKWLVAQGYEIPADAVSNPRFSDLKSSSEKETLEYAAVVKDNGVFVGSNGNLMGANKMTREDMAVVIVRALNTVHNIDLDAYVAAQDFKRDVKDLNSAKAGAKSAIDVLDFFDITNPAVANFNPKNTTTRGQFASFLNRSITSDFSAVTGVASAAVESIKAVNTTTVEVTFKDAVSDISALKFAIEGLEVKNAAIKQTDAKTVVLTTATQEGGKKYEVTLNKAKLGSFVGVSAIIPEKITMTTTSLQGILGKEVTVKADIGVKAAGVPVTFNITGDNTTLNAPQVIEAFTNADGIAEYSYTRYAATTDNVVAYATGDRTKFSSGKVYWAATTKLAITEVTEGNTLANGSKKVYKVKTDSYATAYVGNTTTVDYNYVNVAFNENVDVSPDKLVRTVDVIDTGVSTNAKYPSQVTTGGVNEVRVKVNADGEATFTLNGSSASVTPTVFVDADKNGKFGATELQATAATVKFDLSHTLKLEVKAEGVQNAAAINVANANNKGTGQGGREYTVTIKDDKGVVAPAGTIAYVTFADGSYSTDKSAYILNADGTRVLVNKNTVQAIKVTGTKGEAKFTLVGDRDAYAAPTVYLENGKEAGLDKADLQIVGETTYFVDAVVNNAALTVEDVNGKEVKTLPSSQRAYFHYNSVDQNGFDYFTGALGSYEVAYQVTAHFADVTVSGTFGTKVVAKGTTETVKVTATNGKAVLNVNSENVASNVTVNASASQVSLPNKSATIEFTKGSQVPAVHTGVVESIDTIKNSLKFVGYDAITYSTGSFKNAQGVVIDEAAFESAIKAALLAGDTVKVTSHKNVDGTYTLEIESIASSSTVPVTVTSAIAYDNDGNGRADTIEVTFSKPVTGTGFAIGDFTVTNGATAAGSVADGVAGDNKITITLGAEAPALVVGTLNYAAKTGIAIDTANLTAGSIAVTNAVAGTGVVAAGLTAPGTAGTKQVETLTATAGATTGDAIVTIAATGFNGNNALNINVPVVASDSAAVVGTKVYNALIANTAVTNFFDVTQGGTTDLVILTAKTAAANDTATVITLANNVAATATSADTTPGVAQTGEVVTVTVTNGATNVGTVTATITEGTFSKTVSYQVATGDTVAQVAGKLYAALLADSAVTTRYDLNVTATTVTLTNKTLGTTPATVVTVK